MTPISGGCLCGKVRYTVSHPPISQGICYCHQCQRTGGAYGSPLMVLSASTFENNQADISFSETKSDRGSTVKRHFCKECGSHIFATISDIPSLLTVKANTLDDFSRFTPEYLVWTKSADPLCIFPPGVPSFAEAAPLEVVLNSTLHQDALKK